MLHRLFLLGACALSLSSNAWGQSNTHDEHLVLTCLSIDREDQLSQPTFNSPLCPGTDEVVSVGTRLGVADIDKLTSPATLISMEDIASRAQSQVSDLLRTVPGLSINSSGPSSGLTQLRLRGAEANHVVVLIDGVEVANPTDGAFDFGGLRAEDVTRLEVLRGEQSALYGSDAVAGVVNIITRAGATRESWSASVEAGSRDTLEGQVSAVVPIGGAALTILGNAFTTEGYDISGEDGGNGERDGADSRSLSLGLNAVAIGSTTLSAKYGFTTRRADFDSDADFDGRLDDTDSDTEVDTQTARIDARTDVGAVRTVLTLSRLQTETDTRAAFSSNTTGTRDRASLVGAYGTGVHSITALGEYEREDYAFAGDPDTPSNDTYGVAGDYRYDGDALTITGSLRHDLNDLFDDATTWRVGAGYDTGAFGRFTASAGTAVKTPTLIELFGFFPASRFVGNEDLQPEQSFGYNLGWSYDLAGSEGDGRIAVNYFRSELDDEIITTFNPDFTSGVENLETESTREGVEIEGRYARGAVDLNGSVSVLGSDQNGIEEIRRPDFLASASVSWQATEDLRATLFADHTGAQLDTDFATFSNVELDAFTLVGANLSYDVTESWSVSARAENLLDEDYEEVVGYRSPGRALFVGLRADY